MMHRPLTDFYRLSTVTLWRVLRWQSARKTFPLKSPVSIVLPLLTLALFGCISARAALHRDDPDSFCSFAHRAYPGIHWIELRHGDRLAVDNAILTCTDGEVTITSNYPLGMIDWLREGARLRAKVPGARIITLRVFPVGGFNPGVDVVEVVNVKGRAFYTTSHELVTKHNIGVVK